MTRRVRETLVVLSIALHLAGCGDPLSKVDRLSQVDLQEAAPKVSVVSAPQETDRSGGFLSRLLKRDKTPAPAANPDKVAQAPAETTPDVQAALIDAETAMGATSQTVAAPDTAQSAETPRTRRGVFGFLKRDQSHDPQTPEVRVASIDPAQSLPADETASAGLAEPDKVAAVTDAVPQAEARPRKGLFGLLAGARAKSETAEQGAAVQTASLGGEATGARQNQRAATKGPDAAIVPAGTKLAPGKVARVCSMNRRQMGKAVDRYPERGKGYKIYDSAPGGTGPRPFYITGFADGCARTFTAALALFGSPVMHEQLRYGLPAKIQPYNTTDKAYDKIKSAVCRVGKGKPCGAKIKSLSKDTVFISMYDRVGSSAKWSDILLHRGTLVAVDRNG